MRVTPGSAALLGVIVLVALRLVAVGDLVASMRVQWRPLLSLTSIMVMTGVVDEVGAFERLAARIEAYARRTSAARAFALVFAVSVVTPSLLNNDAAILLLTPLVVALTRRLYPGRAGVTEAFAFAVFLAPGVAPLVVSNPMNMIVAEYAGIRFNAYAATMLPISVAGALVTVRRLALALRARRSPAPPPSRAPSWCRARHPAERGVVALLVVVFVSYPIAAALGGPIWMVTVAGAMAVGRAGARARRRAGAASSRGHVSRRHPRVPVGRVPRRRGLRHVGVVASLSSLVRARPTAARLQARAHRRDGRRSAPRVVDNHPMSILNMLALGAHGPRSRAAGRARRWRHRPAPPAASARWRACCGWICCVAQACRRRSAASCGSARSCWCRR